MSILWDLLSPFWGYIAAALTAILGALGLYVKGRSDAKAKAKAKQAEATIKTMKTADEVQDEIAAKSDAVVRADLGRWLRPD